MSKTSSEIGKLKIEPDITDDMNKVMMAVDRNTATMAR
jgi:hypothetical protein